MDGDLDLPAAIGVARFAAWSGVAVLTVAFLGTRRRIALAEPLVGTLDRMAETALAFERWVVDATVAAATTAVAVGAWGAVAVETEALGPPVDAVARRVVRGAGLVRSFVGGSLARVLWALVALAAFGCLGHGLWPGH